MGGPAATMTFARLFMVPGMGHCQGGPGTDTFNKVGTLLAWVESDRVPDKIAAEHVTNGNVDRIRPLCAYPQIAKYKGAGSPDDASSFACSAP